jgi:hypothetical protein
MFRDERVREQLQRGCAALGVELQAAPTEVAQLFAELARRRQWRLVARDLRGRSCVDTLTARAGCVPARAQ